MLRLILVVSLPVSWVVAAESACYEQRDYKCTEIYGPNTTCGLLGCEQRQDGKYYCTASEANDVNNNPMLAAEPHVKCLIGDLSRIESTSKVDQLPLRSHFSEHGVFNLVRTRSRSI